MTDPRTDDEQERDRIYARLRKTPAWVPFMNTLNAARAAGYTEAYRRLRGNQDESPFAEPAAEEAVIIAKLETPEQYADRWRDELAGAIVGLVDRKKSYSASPRTPLEAICSEMLGCYQE